MTGAAVMAGAAFARDIFRVQGMDVFNRQAYRGFAALLLQDEACRDFTGCKDEAAGAVAGGCWSGATTYHRFCASGAAPVAGRSDSSRPTGSVLSHRVDIDGDGLPAADRRSGSIGFRLGETLRWMIPAE